MRKTTPTPAPAVHDIQKVKQTEIALLERVADEAVDLVTRTISGLELINQQISDSMADIDKYAAELAQTRETMAKKRSNNAAIIANFSKLLSVEAAE